jgi:hypothetical protein
VKARHLGLAADPSASKAETFAKCPASHVLPQATEETVQGLAGTEKHAAMARAKTLETLTEGVGLLQHERAFVVDVKKRESRFVGENVGRKYGSLGPYELPCTLDVDGIRDVDGIPWVRDWKFGTYASEWQLAVQAMAILWLPGQAQVVVDAGFVFLRDTDDEEPRTERYVYGHLELADRADELVRAFDGVPEIAKQLKKKQLPTLRQGAWCKYCPAQTACPAKWNLVRAALGELQTAESTVEALSADRCGEAWEWAKEVERFAEKVKEALKDRAMSREESYPLSSGKNLTWERRKGWAYPQKDKTLALLKRLGATEEQMGAIMVMRADSWAPTERKR